MHIGIYNRWLATLGGGERYTLDLARVLIEAGHAVDLLVHQPLDPAVLRERMRAQDLPFTLRTIPDSPANERVGEASAQYDLFVNISHGDLCAARVPRNVLVVHFPLPLEAYTTAGAVQTHPRTPSRIEWLEGTYGLEHGNGQTWAWTGRRACIEIRRCWPTPARWLRLDLADLLPPSITPRVGVRINGRLVAERIDRWTRWMLRLDAPIRRGQTATVELEIEPWTLRSAGIAPDDRERGLPLQSVHIFGSAVEALIAGHCFTTPWQTIRPTARSRAAVKEMLGSYTTILANSQFTQRWIERRWQKQSQVPYPAVALEVPDLPKQPQILSVGRFFPGSHNEQHLAMIHAFRSLCDAGLTGWEYHLVGGCDEQAPEHRTYLDQVRRAAADYPIRLHVNVPASEVERRYAEASIFWHATGYGEDEEHTPERLEHFGITTAEALMAGCVPVVIAKAGQLETVVHGESGMLWHTLDELQTQTRRLIDDAALLRRLAQGARTRSQLFDMAHFAERVRALVLGN